MKHRILLFILITCSYMDLAARAKPAYALFTTEGKRTNYGKMLRASARADMVLFGELHNNPIAHWLQYALTRDLHEKRRLILGAEMFEADNQQVLNDYLSDSINEKELDSLARLWINYKTDYAPLVNFAKKHQLRFIATNIPRRYANMVFHKGFEALDTLSAGEKRWIAPLPVEYNPELPGYKNMLTLFGENRKETFPKAQAIKDATMAHFILQNYNNGYLFIHFHGTYHTDNYEGILWYLRRQKPLLNYITISTVEQTNLKRPDREHRNKADFILVVDADMTKTY